MIHQMDWTVQLRISEYTGIEPLKRLNRTQSQLLYETAKRAFCESETCESLSAAEMALNQGKLLFSAIGRGNVVLVEKYAQGLDGSTNMSQISLDIMARLDPFTSRKQSFSYTADVHVHVRDLISCLVN
jgi:hypothetical protein